MPNNHFVWTGLQELRAELRALPAELAGEGSHIVEGAANGAAVAVRSEYGKHSRSGNLQVHVTVEKRALGQFGAAMIVKSTAKHAWLFENGSEARHYITKAGKEHKTGAMWGRTPPAHVFIPAVMRARRAMYDALADLLTRHGLRVSGHV